MDCGAISRTLVALTDCLRGGVSVNVSETSDGGFSFHVNASLPSPELPMSSRTVTKKTSSSSTSLFSNLFGPRKFNLDNLERQFSEWMIESDDTLAKELMRSLEPAFNHPPNFSNIEQSARFIALACGVISKMPAKFWKNREKAIRNLHQQSHMVRKSTIVLALQASDDPKLQKLYTDLGGFQKPLDAAKSFIRKKLN